MNSNLTMTELYSKLSKLGFSKEFIRFIGLPSWWTDELDISTNLSVVYEAAGHISKTLLLDLKSLIDTNQEVRFRTYMVYDKITYDYVIKLLKDTKLWLLEHLEVLEDTDTYSDDTLDYFERLLEYN